MRTHNKHIRVYTNGIDVSGYSRAVGALAWMFGAEPDAAVTDECKNILIGQGEIQAGPLSAFLDNDAAGLWNLANAGTQTLNLMVAIGANAAPAANDHVFAWTFEQAAYPVEQGAGFVAVSIPMVTSYASPLTYKRPWGRLLAPMAARTAVNSAVGIDDLGAASALGGIFVYHLQSSNGTVTLTAQEADTNSDVSFANITGATSGAITAAVSPKHGMIALATDAAIKRYLRWQLAFGTATTATFAAAFIRNNIP